MISKCKSFIALLFLASSLLSSVNATAFVPTRTRQSLFFGLIVTGMALLTFDLALARRDTTITLIETETVLIAATETVYDCEATPPPQDPSDDTPFTSSFECGDGGTFSPCVPTGY